MASLKLIFRFIGFSSVPQTVSVVRPNRRIALADAEVDTLVSSETKPLCTLGGAERGAGPTWPPPDGIYWGM